MGILWIYIIYQDVVGGCAACARLGLLVVCPHGPIRRVRFGFGRDVIMRGHAVSFGHFVCGKWL